MSDTFLTLRLTHDPDDDPAVTAHMIAEWAAAEIVDHVGTDPRIVVALDHPVVQALVQQRNEANAIVDELTDRLYRAADALGMAADAVEVVHLQQQIVKGALAQAEAERIALADRLRAVLESQGLDKVSAALVVQDIIDSAEPR